MSTISNEEKLLSELNGKLDVLIKVVSIQVGDDKTVTERARLLKMAGVDNHSISQVLNTSPDAVRSFTKHLRKKKKR
jgi:hypothetical protein